MHATRPRPGRGEGMILLWSLGPRRLELHQDGPHRCAVLLDGGQVVLVARLPPWPRHQGQASRPLGGEPPAAGPGRREALRWRSRRAERPRAPWPPNPGRGVRFSAPSTYPNPGLAGAPGGRDFLLDPLDPPGEDG
jgi:hypothetical protein